MTILLAQEAANATFLLWGFALLAAAIVLVVIELFVPSGGLLAALAGVSLIGSVSAFFMYDTLAGLVAFGLYLILAPIVIWAILKFWIHSPMAGKIILGGEEMLRELQAEGELSAAERTERARQARLAELRALIGAEGVTVTSLRPVGTIKIGGRRIDGLAETGTIEANTPIVVTDVYDNQIKVRPK